MHTFHPRLATVASRAASVLAVLLLVSSFRPSLAAAAPAPLPGDTIAAAPDSTPTSPAIAAPDSVGLIARLLAANGAPTDRARPAARAILKYSRQRSLDPLLIVGIIGVENATLAPRARSRVGAQGIMQVMPSWKRDITECGRDLREVFVNVCFGTRILQIALDASTSVREALLRYNGCVRAPGCHRYAAAVFSQAGRAAVLSRMEAASVASAASGRAVVAVTPSHGLAGPRAAALTGGVLAPTLLPAVVTP